MATSTSAFPLATESSYPGEQDPLTGSDAGASGHSTGGFAISRGAMVAIIVVVCVVGVIGICSSILFFVAKKREWKVRERIRKSARKVVTALTPRRSEFPRSVKESSGRGRGGRERLDDVPPTPRIKPDDLEKGLGMTDKKRINFSRK
ncbi:hypothetical protein QBC33DRAFT_565954 [Phialemonium atrogriseum]|uniref:Uncharacterized protein n=1 Tax=Phialemonium atrogriseum TaxID=1093897 RepID=A0AAJ0FR06_9PEZI|nr:uncharacterized protein QBC33DRAFT_565954 [Phialemonium atrogriseum]KAK1771808.1 hypothetical protein QBC33DRAFT_565954 [Phialemonium atrogriseum]